MKLLFLILSIIIAANANAYELKGKVVKVADGDTLTLLDSNKQQHKIRLADIDAPESKQPFGNRTKQHLSDLTFGKVVTASCKEKDRYERNVCTVYSSGIDVNKSLIENGFAWVYDRYNSRNDLPYLQAQAKAAKVGLWGLPEAQIINPADWRKGNQVQQQVKEVKAKQSNQADYTCGSKRYCKQMTSCAEAKFYLNQCGVSRLDRDKDGIPCESICNDPLQ